MAQFSMEAYKAQQAAKRSANGSKGNNGRSTRFVNEFIKNDGDTVVVRLPYHSLDDLIYETTHKVRFPGDKYDKTVRCSGEGCLLCKEGVKLNTRFFLKCIAYVPDDVTGEIVLHPAIWDRPAAFADIDLKNLMQEYGDLTECLFKIKRNGSGLDTRYTLSYVANKTVYNPEIYKADFSILENVDPVKICTKTVEQYIETTQGEPVVKTQPVQQVNVQPTAYVEEKPWVEDVEEKSNAQTYNAQTYSGQTYSAQTYAEPQRVQPVQPVQMPQEQRTVRPKYLF